MFSDESVDSLEDRNPVTNHPMEENPRVKSLKNKERFGLDANGKPCLMEINPIPGLTPGYSDICIQAAAEGIKHEDLVLEILYLAAGRWGLLEPRV